MKVIIYIICSLFYIYKGIKIKRRELYIDNNEDVPAKSLFIDENEYQKENSKLYLDDYKDSQMFYNQDKYNKSANKNYYDDLDDNLFFNQSNKEKLDNISEYTDDLVDGKWINSKEGKQYENDEYIDNLEDHNSFNQTGNETKDNSKYIDDINDNNYFENKTEPKDNVNKYTDDLKDNNFFVNQSEKKDNVNQYTDNLNDWNGTINIKKPIAVREIKEDKSVSKENSNVIPKVQSNIKNQQNKKEEYPIKIKQTQENQRNQPENSIHKNNQPIEQVLESSEPSNPSHSTAQANGTTSAITNINIVIKPPETENKNDIQEDSDTELLKQLNDKLGELLYKKQVNNFNQEDGNLEDKLLELLSSIVNQPKNISIPLNNEPPRKIQSLPQPFLYYQGNNNFQNNYPNQQSQIPQSNTQTNFLMPQPQSQLNMNYQPIPSVNNYQVQQPQTNPQLIPINNENNNPTNHNNAPCKYEKYNKMFKKLRDQIKGLQNNIKAISNNDKQVDNNNYNNDNQLQQKKINIIQPIIQRSIEAVKEVPIPISKSMMPFQPPAVIQTELKPIPPQYTYYKIYNRN